MGIRTDGNPFLQDTATAGNADYGIQLKDAPIISFLVFWALINNWLKNLLIKTEKEIQKRIKI